MLKDIHTHRLSKLPDIQLLSCCYKDVDSEQLNRAVHLSVGIHPWYLTEEDLYLQQEWVLEKLNDPRVLAIGEGGLDKLCSTPLKLQEEAFRWLIEISESHQLPLIIHNVKAGAEIIRLKKEYKPHSPWIIHGFRGKPQQANEYIRHGFYLSFGEKYSEASLREVPADRLFLETDESLIPIGQLYQRVAEFRGMTPGELEESEFENINHVFYRK